MQTAESAEYNIYVLPCMFAHVCAVLAEHGGGGEPGGGRAGPAARTEGGRHERHLQPAAPHHRRRNGQSTVTRLRVTTTNARKCKAKLLGLRAGLQPPCRLSSWTQVWGKTTSVTHDTEWGLWVLIPRFYRCGSLGMCSNQ